MIEDSMNTMLSFFYLFTIRIKEDLRLGKFEFKEAHLYSNHKRLRNEGGKFETSYLK